MKVIKKTNEYTIYQKRSGRHAVQGADKQWINGEDKAKILVAENLIKLTAAAPEPEPEVVEEVAAEEAVEETVSEETAAEEPAAETVDSEATDSEESETKE